MRGGKGVRVGAGGEKPRNTNKKKEGKWDQWEVPLKNNVSKPEEGLHGKGGTAFWRAKGKKKKSLLIPG